MADYNSAYTGAQIDANLAKAATAVQPAGLATVATSGAYNDLSGKPTLGTAAAAASTDFATAAQGTLANSATQPGDDAADLGSGSATDGYVLTADGAGGAAWEAAAGGGGSSVTDYLRTRLGTIQDVFNMADTWNASGTTFTGIKLNVTNTASASGAVYNKTGSALFELQTNGDTKFWVGRDGGLWLKTSEGGGAGRSIAGIGSAGTETWRVEGNGGAQFNYLGVTDFLAATRLLLSNDAILVRDAANTLAQRNGVNAQAFNLYNTYTDASNYERGFMRFVSNVLQIGTEKLGTGTARALAFQTDGTTRLTIETGGNAVFANNVRAGRFIGSSLLGVGGVDFSPNVYLIAPTSGVIRLSDSGDSTFNRLQFGGTSSSFPAIKRSATSMQARLADDSAFTNIQGKLTTDTAYTAGVTTPTGYIVLFDSAGTAYKVPAEAL